MHRVFLLSLVLLLCGNLRGADESDATARLFNLPAENANDAVEAIEAMFPNGAEQVRIAEVGPDSVVQSTHLQLPNAEELLKLVADPSVGNHLSHETVAARPPAPPPLTPGRPSYLPKASWRIKLLICRVVAGGSIAAAIILLKDNVHGVDYEWGRAITNAAVHGSVNGFFQLFGFRVADLSYADWNKNRFFPNFGMNVGDLLYRTFLNSWPKRVLCTLSSVLIYRLTDFAFTGVFEYSTATLIGIAMNIGATLAPAALGLEMAARMGPPQAAGLEPRNNHVFDLQNLTISVLFAAALALNSEEMNQAFGIHGVWAPVYFAVASGGILWWTAKSRWTNPDLVSAGDLAQNVAKNGVQACGNFLRRVGQFFTGRGRNKP